MLELLKILGCLIWIVYTAIDIFIIIPCTVIFELYEKYRKPTPEEKESLAALREDIEPAKEDKEAIFREMVDDLRQYKAVNELSRKRKQESSRNTFSLKREETVNEFRQCGYNAYIDDQGKFHIDD